MSKYEYKVVSVSTETGRAQKEVNKIASEGWRLVTVRGGEAATLGGVWQQIIFERELIEPEGTRWDGERFLSLDGKQKWDGKEWKRA